MQKWNTVGRRGTQVKQLDRFFCVVKDSTYDGTRELGIWLMYLFIFLIIDITWHNDGKRQILNEFTKSPATVTAIIYQSRDDAVGNEKQESHDIHDTLRL